MKEKQSPQMISEEAQWNALLDETFVSRQRIPVEKVPKTRRPVNKKALIGIIIVLLLASAAVTGWLLYQNRETPENKLAESALKTCREALEQWQSLEDHGVYETYQHYGDNMGSCDLAKYWRFGEDWFRISRVPTANSYGLIRSMKKDGTLYFSGFSFLDSSSDAGETYSTPWEKYELVAPEQEEAFIPWPMRFSWKDNEVQYYSSTSHNDILTGVSVSIIPSDSQYPEHSPYYVHFSFDESGTLIAVKQITISLDPDGSTSCTEKTYELIEVSEESVANTIDKMYQEATLDLLLSSCKAALEAYQSQTFRKAEVEQTVDGETPGQYTYWHYADQHLVKWYIDDGNHRPGWLLQNSGNTYCQGIAPYYPEGSADYSRWVLTDTVPDTAFSCWLDEYQWNYSDIQFVSTTAEGENTCVTFTVTEEIRDNLGGTANSRTVTFCLNTGDAIVYVQDTYTVEGTDGGEPYSTAVVSKTVVSFDEDEIRGMVNGRISEANTAQTEQTK